MKTLAIDTATTRISIAATNGALQSALLLNAEMRQSEKIVPAIEYVLEQAEIKARDLQLLAVTLGPGSFTGLRLGMSALKALQLASGAPLYGVATLDAYAYPFKTFSGTLVPVIDAKKNRFYTAIYRTGKKCLQDCDTSVEDFLLNVDEEEKLLLVGDDAPLFAEKIRELRPLQQCSVVESNLCTAMHLCAIAKDLHAKGDSPLQDYDGPVYIRKSEAEENAEKK